MIIEWNKYPFYSNWGEGVGKMIIYTVILCTNNKNQLHNIYIYRFNIYKTLTYIKYIYNPVSTNVGSLFFNVRISTVV